MPKVFVTQLPSRLENGAWIPTVDVSPAKEFGELRIILPMGINYNSTGEFSEALEEALRDFEDGDYLIPLGDPLIQAAAIAAVVRADPSPFMILKWDRFTHKYAAFEV